MATNRIAILQRDIDPSSSLSIEIGPLDNPILSKDTYDVRYLDFAPADVLRDKYVEDPHVKEIVDVDIVWNGNRPLVEATGQSPPYDAIVASHVVEHVPDPIRWFSYLAGVLRPGGIVSLAVPDKRFTFDCNRRLSEFSDILDAYLREAVVPSYAQLYDYHTKSIPVDTGLMWAGLVDYSQVVRPGDLEREAFNGCIALHDGGPYVDVHCHTFTPSSFVSLIERLGEFDLIDFSIVEVVPTQKDTFEFFVRLTRLDPDASAEDKEGEQKAGIARAREAIARGPVARIQGELDLASDAIPYVVSSRERQLIEHKRHAFDALRRRAEAIGRRMRSTTKSLLT